MKSNRGIRLGVHTTRSTILCGFINKVFTCGQMSIPVQYPRIKALLLFHGGAFATRYKMRRRPPWYLCGVIRPEKRPFSQTLTRSGNPTPFAWDVVVLLI